MQALVYDKEKQPWATSVGFIKTDIADPVIDPEDETDKENVVIRLHYAGVCGTDRGLWYRQNFKDAVLNSLTAENKNQRIIGHEICGDIVAMGSRVQDKFGLRIGDFVSAESHIICSQCYQCIHGQANVCTNEKIMGVTHDGGFAEYVKLPTKIIWPTDRSLIRTELACLQEPFGNAVHAASKADLRHKNVAIFGCGPIAMFLIIIAAAKEAKNIIVVEPKEENLIMAKKLGATQTIKLDLKDKEESWQSDSDVVSTVRELTDGLGADVSFEMAGFNSSVNNALESVRRGGDVVLFGLKGGDFIIPSFEKLIVKGITQHSVIGRKILTTRLETKKLFESQENGVQEKLWQIILNKGQGTILDFNAFDPIIFEEKMAKQAKFIIKFS